MHCVDTDGKQRIFIGGADGVIYVKGLADYHPVGILREHSGTVLSLICENGIMASGDDCGCVCVWDTKQYVYRVYLTSYL